MFVMDDKVVSFNGVDSRAEADQATIKIDQVNVQEGGGKRTEYRAKGTCTYTNPYKGPSTIQCSATASGKAFIGTFTSDGKAPDVLKL